MLKTMRKKSVLSIMALTLMVFTLVAPKAYAGSLSRSYSGQFTKSWMDEATSGSAQLEYGFNTWLINEDVSYANHSGASHNAKIVNGNGVHTSRSKSAGNWSNLEVQHSGSSVSYYCEW